MIIIFSKFCYVSIKNSPNEVSSRTPLFTIHSPGGVKYLSWQGPSFQEESNNNNNNNNSSSNNNNNNSSRIHQATQIPIVETLFSSQREQREHRTPQVFSGAGLAAQQLSALPSRESAIGEEIRSLMNNTTTYGRTECKVNKNRYFQI